LISAVTAFRTDWWSAELKDSVPLKAARICKHTGLLSEAKPPHLMHASVSVD
jgi:hypothetical protein